jgi:hypothetical protein
MRLLRPRATHAAYVVAALAIAACGGSDSTGPKAGAPETVQRVSGDEQLGVVGTALGSPLVVRVVDADQRPVANATVRWTVTDGNGSVAPASSTTDSRGEARATWTLGTLAVPGRVSAIVSGAAAASFGSTAGAGPVATVAAATRSALVAPGDTVRLVAAARDQFGNAVANAGLVWTSLNSGIASVDATGLIRGIVEGSTGVSVAAAGKTDVISVQVNANAPSSSACSGITPLDLRVGEVRTFSANQGGDLCIAGGVSGAEYALVSYAASSVAASQTSFSVTASGIGGAVADVSSQRTGPALGGLSLSRAGTSGASFASASLAEDQAFEERLRTRERRDLGPLMDDARTLRRTRTGSTTGALSLSRAAVDLAVGDLLSLNSQADKSCSDLKPRAGRVAAVSQYAIIVADTLNPAGGFTDAEYNDFAVAFDRDVYPVDVQAFGAPGDVDGNRKVIVFFTSAVNALTPRGASYYVGGFFYGRDLFPKVGTSQLQACAGSNEAEMFYMLVPDPDGAVNGNKRSKSFVSKMTVATLAHEFQHLINSSRRLYVNDADDFEDTWLNEGLSHIAEELLFYRVSGLAPRQKIDAARLRAAQTTLDAFNNYGISNFGRFISYLEAPETTSPFADNDELETRGATWHFLRYAADRLGEADGDLWSRLVNSKKSGADNLRAVLGTDLDGLYRDWAVTTFVGDLGLAGMDTRYASRSWNYRSIVTAISSAGGTYPLRTFALSEGAAQDFTLNGGGSGYVRLAVPPAKVASVRARNGTQPLSPVVRLTLVRTK